MAEEKRKIGDEKTAEIEKTTPPASVTVTETEATLTPNISRSRKWLSEKMENKEWDDDEAFEDDMMAHLEGTDKSLASYAESDGRIGRILERNPEFAAAIDAMDKGMPARVALRRYMGDFMKDEPQPGEEDFEAMAEATERYLADKKKTDDEIALRNANIEKSDIILADFIEEQNWPEERATAFVEFLRSAFQAFSMGDISKDVLTMMRDAFLHNEDVAEAKEAGVIEGRNGKIEAKRIARASETDGMPMGGGTSPEVVEEEPTSESALENIVRGFGRRL
jgi:hypothetical protein